MRRRSRLLAIAGLKMLAHAPLVPDELRRYAREVLDDVKAGPSVSGNVMEAVPDARLETEPERMWR